MNYPISLLLIIFLVGMLAGCSPKTYPASTIPEESSNSTSHEVGIFYPASEWASYIDNDTLWVVNLDSGLTTKLTTLPDEAIPNLSSITTIKQSPDGSKLIWHAPAKGLFYYDVNSKTVESLYSGGDWFNSNPFYLCHKQSNSIWLIDGEGTEIIQINLADLSTKKYEISRPFGSEFLISDDARTIAVVAGFREQRLDSPEYMILNTSTLNESIISTDSELADRFSFAFFDDSLLVFEKGNLIVEYPLADGENQSRFISLDSIGRITEIQKIDNYLYVSTAEGTLYAIDLYSKEVVKSLPTEVAFRGMNRYTLHPVSKQAFLVEEIIDEDSNQYRRLWISDLLGIKRLLVPKFGTISIVSEES